MDRQLLRRKHLSDIRRRGGPRKESFPSGETKRLKIPESTAPGQRLRVRGEGFKTKSKTGDALVRVQPAFPDELTDDQRAHFEALKESGL